MKRRQRKIRITALASRLLNTMAIGLASLGASHAQAWTPTRSAEIDSLQSACWTLIFSSPEAADSLIEAVLERLNGDAPDTVRAVSYNHLAILRSTQARLKEASEAFQNAADAFAASPRRRAIVLRNLALALKDEGRYNEALATLLVSDSICGALGDELGLTMGQCTRGNVTMYMGDYDQSTRALMKCLDGLDPNDPKQAKSRVIELQNLANVFANSGNHKYADALYGQCADEIKDMGRTYQWLQVCNNQISSKINIGQLAEALALQEQTQPAIAELGATDLLALSHAHGAFLHRKLGDLETALSEAGRAMDLIESAPRQAEYIRKEYALVLNALGRHAEASALAEEAMASWPAGMPPTEDLVYLKLEWIRAQAAMAPESSFLQRLAATAAEMDSVFEALSSERMAVMTAHYQLEEQMLKNRQLETDNALLAELADQTQSRNFLLGISLVLLVLMGGLAIRSSRLKSRALAGGLAEERARRSELEMQRKEREIASERRLQAMKLKELELVTATMELASFERKLEKAIASAEAAGASEQTLRHFRNIGSSGDFLKSFKLRFENIHPGYSDDLRENHPELTANDIEFCELLKLGLSTKELAHVLNISASSVMTRKYRIRKRMGLDEGARVEDHL